MIIWAASRIVPRYGQDPYHKDKGIKYTTTDQIPVKYFEHKDDCIEFILSSKKKLILEKIYCN